MVISSGTYQRRGSRLWGADLSRRPRLLPLRRPMWRRGRGRWRRSAAESRPPGHRTVPARSSPGQAPAARRWTLAPGRRPWVSEVGPSGRAQGRRSVEPSPEAAREEAPELEAEAAGEAGPWGRASERRRGPARRRLRRAQPWPRPRSGGAPWRWRGLCLARVWVLRWWVCKWEQVLAAGTGWGVYLLLWGLYVAYVLLDSINLGRPT